MTIKKVDDLTTDELNEQVAICNGWKKAVDVCCDSQIWITNDGVWLDNYDPCHNAQQAHEIILINEISVAHRGDHHDCMKKWVSDIKCKNHTLGETPLIAAMRCFVKSVKGETVEL